MLLNKLRSNKAETLLETLVSMLIGVLSITLLTTSVMVAAKINKATKDADTRYNEELRDAEIGSTLKERNANITIRFADGSSESVTVDIYGYGDFATYVKGGDAP